MRMMVMLMRNVIDVDDTKRNWKSDDVLMALRPWSLMMLPLEPVLKLVLVLGFAEHKHQNLIISFGTFLAG